MVRVAAALIVCLALAAAVAAGAGAGADTRTAAPHAAAADEAAGDHQRALMRTPARKAQPRTTARTTAARGGHSSSAQTAPGASASAAASGTAAVSTAAAAASASAWSASSAASSSSGTYSSAAGGEDAAEEDGHAHGSEHQHSHAAHGHSHSHSGGRRSPGEGGVFTWSKLWALVLVFGVAMGGGGAAVRLQSFKHKEVVMELGNSLAGGIFLAAGMVHMLPEANEALAEVYPDLPIGPILCLGGMLLPLWIENVVVTSAGHSHGHGGGGSGGGGGHVHGLPLQHDDNNPVPVILSGPVVGTVTSVIVPYLIALLLGIHSLIEGIAIGVENSESRASMILLAVLCHKGLAAFSLGVALTRANVPSTRFLQVITFFSLMTPLGGLLGALASASVADSLQSQLADLILAFAAGTFLYVGLVEIILVELGPDKPNVGLKFATVLCGAALMITLGISMHAH